MMISLHGTTIYDLTFDFASASSENASAAREFLIAQEAFRKTLVGEMLDDSSLREHIDADRIERNQLLLLVVDQLSLHACWGVHDTVEVPNVPGQGDRLHTLQLRPARSGEHIEVDPWPFVHKSFEGQIEGRTMPRPCLDPVDFARAFSSAPVATIHLDLRPA